MPGTSPGMTRWVGRSDGSHPQGRRRPQPAPPLRPSFISLKRRALTPFAWLRAYARGAVAPSGPLRSPAHLSLSSPDSFISLNGARSEPAVWLISPCPPSALSGRRRRKAPTPPSVPLRLSAGRGTGGAGPGCQAARRLRDTKEKMRGQATAVTVPRVPRGGGRLSRSARWPMRVRAAQMFRLSYINGSNASSPIFL